jgi:hypothetical protein
MYWSSEKTWLGLYSAQKARSTVDMLRLREEGRRSDQLESLVDICPSKHLTDGKVKQRDARSNNSSSCLY